MCHDRGHSPIHCTWQVAFRGTDSHSWYNWAENMKYWRAKYQMPYPGSEGSLVHSGEDEGKDKLHMQHLLSVQKSAAKAVCAAAAVRPVDECCKGCLCGSTWWLCK